MVFGLIVPDDLLCAVSATGAHAPAIAPGPSPAATEVFKKSRRFGPLFFVLIVRSTGLVAPGGLPTTLQGGAGARAQTTVRTDGDKPEALVDPLFDRLDQGVGLLTWCVGLIPWYVGLF